MAQPQKYEIQNKRMLIVAAILALVVVILLNIHIAQIRSENNEKMVEVLVAAQDLHAGDQIKPESFTTTVIAERLVPEANKDLGDVTKKSDEKTILGMYLSQEVAKDRILKWGYLRGGLSSQVDSIQPAIGYAIVSIPVERDSCPSDVLMGDRVDLYTGRTAGKNPGELMPVMEGVLVKAVSGSGRTGSSRAVTAISVEVDREDFKGLTTLLNSGRKIIIAKRNPDDTAKMVHFNPEVLKGFVPAAPPEGAPTGAAPTPGRAAAPPPASSTPAKPVPPVPMGSADSE